MARRYNLTATLTAVSQLSEKIRYRYSEATPSDSQRYARALLESQTSRTARALVRADLYFNWRCAHRGSNPRDLYDDMYHVLSAIYCDAYVAKEPGQAEYAHFLLTPGTGVYIYTPEVPIDRWLESLTLKQAAWTGGRRNHETLLLHRARWRSSVHKDKYAQMPDKTLFNPELPPTETAVMRATVPSDVASGPTALQIIGGINSGGGYDSDTVESGFQVGTTSDAVPAARFKPGSRHFLHHHRLKNVPTPSARISSSTLFDPHRRQR